ncbi:MAG: Gfo/Idh/MocA family oxidoreductase, partial [Verrucomicrobiota bacterium]
SKRLFERAEDLLADPDIDIVSIASYDDAHFEQCKLAIAHGKHIYVEKPFCMHAEHAHEIRQLLEANPGIRFSSNHVLRVSSRFQELKQRIQGGEFGEIYYLEGDYQYGRLHKITTSWRGEIPFYSVVYGGAVHVIDLLLWLTEDEVVEVSAYGNQIASRQTQFRFNDMVAAILKLKSGAIAKVTANFGCKRPHFHAIEVFGTQKSFVNRPGAAEIWQSSEKGDAPTEMETPYRDYQKPDLICSFIDWILGRSEPLVTPDDVFRTMATCFAVERAAAEGKPIQVERI